MATKIFFSNTYEKQLCAIEDFIINSTDSIDLVEQFLDEHDKILDFLKDNPLTAATHPTTGDRSWPFANGRYRLFYVVKNVDSQTSLYLLDIIDNRQANLKVYPGNSIRSYFEDE